MSDFNAYELRCPWTINFTEKKIQCIQGQ